MTLQILQYHSCVEMQEQHVLNVLFAHMSSETLVKNKVLSTLSGSHNPFPIAAIV